MYATTLSVFEAYYNRLLSVNRSSVEMMKEKAFVDLQFLANFVAPKISADFHRRFMEHVIPFFLDYQAAVTTTVTSLQYGILATGLIWVITIIYKANKTGRVVFETALRLPLLSDSQSKLLRLFIKNV